MLARFLQPLPAKLLREVAAEYQFDKHHRKITFEPYFRMHLMLALSRYETLHEVQQAMRDDPLFRLHGANLEVSVSALSQVPERRGSGAFEELLQVAFDALAAVPHSIKRARGLTTTTLQSIQDLLVRTQIVDSSTFSLPPSIAEWAKTRSNAAGFKLHLRLSGGYGGVAQVEFSPAREHDRRHLDALIAAATPGDLFLLDRGYQDYRLFDRLSDRQLFFVSKLKRDHHCEVIEERDLERTVTPSGYTLLKELRVRLGAEGKETRHEYRLLDVLTPEGEETTLVTNDWTLEPEQICALYQYRWTIEIVFRWLKHTLGLKHLVSTKREGVTIQIVMALLAYALLLLYQEGDRKWSPKQLLLQAQFQLHHALIAYGYSLAQAQCNGPPN